MTNSISEFIKRTGKKDAARIRQRVKGRYIAPARLAGKKEVTVWADEIHAALFPNNVGSDHRYPNIHQAIVGNSEDPNRLSILEEEADVEVLWHTGPGPGSQYQIGWK